MNEKERENIEIEILESKIETTKIELDRYVKAIVRSSFIDVCTGGAYFNDLYMDMLREGYKAIADSKSPKKDNLKKEWFMSGMFGKRQSEKEMLEANLKHYEQLVDWAKHNLDRLDYKQKEKMVMDCLEQQNLWSNQFGTNFDLFNGLKTKTVNQKAKPILNKKIKVKSK